MQKYYHFTEYKFLDSIGELGLIPMKGNRSKSCDEYKTAVFVSEGIFPTCYMYYTMRGYYDYYSGENGKSMLLTAYNLITHYNNLKDRLKYYAVCSKEYKAIRNELKALNDEYHQALNTIHRVEQVNPYVSFDDYSGDGVYLSISDIPNVNCYLSLKHNCWTHDTIPPKKINVLLLRSKSNGKTIDSKKYVIYYFLSTLSLEDIQSQYDKMFKHLMNPHTAINDMNFFKNLLISNKDRLEQIKNNYELVEMPIKEYLKMKYGSDEKDPTLKKTTNNN